MLKKTVCLALFATVSLYACSSDCLECHPKLKQLEYNKTNKYYKEHHFLITCTKCHKNHPSKGMDECGADCFDCHSRKKLINTPVPEHQKLSTCTKCHKDTLQQIIPAQPNNDFLNFKQK
ncbi:hypothetical protein C3L23_03295 [Nautilia sp. PV-1]|jgi:hypothetical protein|uniref:hypothetical protein n=1 Tax=Nautilia sp. PV-1 TaxID=2579250 RepID=UPI000FD6F507|nr:hypothetical protein [Nautilia sp. PV-1]AZV46332.1 hypothetical protein C3L23_03295 [Nautilia sp. PV-1]